MTRKGWGTHRVGYVDSKGIRIGVELTRRTQTDATMVGLRIGKPWQDRHAGVPWVWWEGGINKNLSIEEARELLKILTEAVRKAQTLEWERYRKEEDRGEL